MKSKRTILLILIIIASMIPEARAITPQSQTVKIIDTHDDMFITEVGIGIDSSLVTIKDPNMDIRSFLVFRELEINFWEPLKNATLRLHTSNTLDFDADSSIIVYGMALSDLQLEGYLIPSTVLSIGFTDAYTNYNTSEFYGGQWHEINVTSIVEELIRNPNWDGAGVGGTDPGDAIGFHIVGAEGDDKRYFYDFSVGNGLEAQLVIHWNHAPTPPSGYDDYEYNSTHGDFDIWYGNVTGWLNYTSFTEIDPANKFTVENSTYVYTTQDVDGNDNVKLVKTDDSKIFDIKFGINVTSFHDEVPDAARHWIYLFGGRELENYAVDAWDCDFFFIALTSDETLSKIEPYFYIYDGGANEDKLGTAYSAPWMRWNHFTFNIETKEYSWKMYTDIEMTNLDAEISGTHTRSVIGSEYIYALNTYDSTYGSVDKGQFKLFSRLNLGNYIISLNGTVIMDNGDPLTFDTVEDAEDFIETYDPDPEDPNPGGTWQDTGPFTRFRTRFYILMMGFGLLFGPLIYFAMRRPSGYEFVIGLFIMLVGYSFLIAAAGI